MNQQTKAMRRIFYLLGLLTIFNGYAGAQIIPNEPMDGVFVPSHSHKWTPGGSSNLTFTIKDTSEQNFLDEIEAKLLNTISTIIEGNNKILMSCYDVSPVDGTDWRIQKDKQELKNWGNPALPKQDIPTNYQYELIVRWDSTLRYGYVLGFSKKYYCPIRTVDPWSHKEVCAGIWNMAVWHIPLAQYQTFLTQKEMERIYRIIKKNFIRFVNDDKDNWPITDTTTFSYRKLQLTRPDTTFVLMPLALWTKQFKDWILSGEILCFKNAYCTGNIFTNRADLFTKTEVENILECRDTIVSIGNRLIPVQSDASFPSITIAEQWKFDTVTSNSGWVYEKYALKISRQIKSIAMNMGCDYASPPRSQRLWLSYKELNGESSTIASRYYSEQLDNALFKKLNLSYWLY